MRGYRRSNEPVNVLLIGTVGRERIGGVVFPD